MARIQVMHLPASAEDDSPFAIVIDQVSDVDQITGNPDALTYFKDACGARAILVSEGTLDVA